MTTIERTIVAFLNGIAEARHMHSDQQPKEKDDLLRHARELLDILDEELRAFAGREKEDLSALARAMRDRLTNVEGLLPILH